MPDVYLNIVDLTVSPSVVELGASARVDWKVRNNAGTLVAPGSTMRIRIAGQRGEEILALTATGVTVSSTGIYYYLLKNSTLLASLLPGRCTVELQAAETATTEIYKAKTHFWIKRG